MTLLLPMLLAACSTAAPQPATATAAQQGRSKTGTQLQFALASGVYRCELGQSVEIQRNAQNVNLIVLHWQGSRHTLERHDSTSGLPRYEDRQNGLLWIDLPWKSVLMDVRSGRPLANECKIAPGKTTRS
jgi:hypothetical protein